MLGFFGSLPPEQQAAIFTGIGGILLAAAAYMNAKAKKLESEARPAAPDDMRAAAGDVLAAVEDLRDLLVSIDKSLATLVTIMTMVGRRD